MKITDICIQCGETREAIKKHHLLCGTYMNTEAGRELDLEWGRHRFKPYSKKELEGQAKDDAEYIKQMGEMADMVLKSDLSTVQ